MPRIIGGVIAGIVVFITMLTVLELIAHQLFPGARSAPSTGVLAFVVAAYFLSALGGGIAAGRISRRHWTVWTIAVMVAAGAAYTLTTMAHPLWMQIASIAAPLLGGFAASRLSPRDDGGPDLGNADAAL